MTNLLIKLFVKDYNNPERTDVRKRYGTLSSVVGIALNILLSALKLAVGLLTASVAITADALNNLSDAGASCISLVSFKLSAKPADRDHPFGHARIEYIASMIVSFIILLVGFETIIDAGKKIFGISEADNPDFSVISLIIIGASVLGKLWLGLFYKKIGNKINSSVIKASGTDSLMDAVSTTAVLVSSIVIKLTNVAIIDSIVGLGVAVLIIVAGVRILNETKNALLGEAPVAETVDSIKAIVAEEPLVLGIHDMIVHNYGPNRFITSFHAEVDGKGDIYMLHDAIDNLEKRIGEELNIQCTVHLDPIATDDEAINELRDLVCSVASECYSGIGIHDFRAVIGHTHTNVIFDVEVPFEIKDSHNEIIDKISNAIKDRRADVFCVITVDRV